jgi:hypothetical protein
MAAWHAVEPTKLLANGGSSVTIYGACMPVSAITFVFAGFSKLFA